MLMEVTIIRSNRKTLAIQIKPDCSVVVRAPKRATMKEIEKVLREKEPWIKRNLDILRTRAEMASEEEKSYLTDKEVEELAKKAASYIPARVKYYAEIIGVSYGRITIRNQRTRWGSCSSKGNLNFNCLLMLSNPEVIDYIVVHELCHRKEMNHSKAFWDEVKKVLPDYKKSEKWLKNEGVLVMNRLKGR